MPQPTDKPSESIPERPQRDTGGTEDDAFLDQDVILGRAYDSVLMARLLGYLRPYLGLVALTLVLTLGIAAVEVYWPHLLGEFIDGPFKDLLQARGGDAAPDASLGPVYGFAAILLGFLILQFLIRWGHMVLTSILGQRAILDLRIAVFRHLERLDIRYFERNPVGRLITRVTNDVESLNELFATGVIALAADLLRLVVIFVVMFLINWRLALIVLVAAPFVGLTSWIFRGRMLRAFREMRRRIAAVNASLQENLSGMRLIQAFRQEAKAYNGLKRRVDRHYDAAMETVFNFALFAPLIGFFSNLVLAVLLYIGGVQIAETVMATGTGGATAAATGTSLGEFTMFYFWTRRAFEPLRQLAEKYNVLQSAMASAERLFKIIDTAPRVADPADPKPLGAIRGEVRFEDVTFAYRGEDWVLQEVSFSVPAGHKVALVGATGAGKTTVTRLLTRFYDVQHGRVLVDGTDVRAVARTELRRQIAVIFQDVYLFAGSILENIRLGDESIREERVREVCRELGVDRFIGTLPEGYQTDVKERGLALSLGQRQVLAFARAMVFDPRILVLDEATASVDTESEAVVQTALDHLLKGRTALIVAHRLSTIRACDNILVFHKGRLREEGNHDALLKQSGIYARLYELQYREMNGEAAG